MKIEILTSLSALEDMERFAALAALTCHDNTAKMNSEGYKPSDTLKHIIKMKHESILEHINLTFSVKDLSRACLQELARHRHISLSVESTRHTLRKKFLDNNNEITLPAYTPDDFIMLPNGSHFIVRDIFMQCLEILSHTPKEILSNDELKYFLPEFWPTNLILTTNIRSLRHIIELRTAPAALEEFQDLARGLFEAVPQEFRYLLEDCVYHEGKPTLHDMEELLRKFADFANISQNTWNDHESILRPLLQQASQLTKKIDEKEGK